MKKPELGTYHYKAKVIDNYDGDTVKLSLSLGLSIEVVEKIRLNRINTPEVRGSEKVEGIRSKLALESYLSDNSDDGIEVTTIKDKKGKYGRYIGELWCGNVNMNDWLVENGYAEYKEY